MPLRDHFKPPVTKRATWESFHATWPVTIVQQLRHLLPPGYVAQPHVRVGVQMEIDIGASKSTPTAGRGGHSSSGQGGIATAVWTGAEPAVAVETEPPEEYEYEVQVFDVEWERRLVAAIELVSPANKDRQESRDIFVAKCAALLRKGVAVSIVDLVTPRRFNLYAQLMEAVHHPDHTMTQSDPAIYASSCRWVTLGDRARLEAWSYPLLVGKPLPTLPLWLNEDRVIPLDLEPSYEQACVDLWIADP